MFTKFTLKMFKTIPIYVAKVDDADIDDDNNSNDVGKDDKDDDNALSIAVHKLLRLPHLHSLLQGEEQTNRPFKTFRDIFCVNLY